MTFDELLNIAPYSLAQPEKEALLTRRLKELTALHRQNCPEYAESHRLLKFIHYFTPVPDKEIPATSLLREFIGG